ncbi:hypothetical protein Ctha_0451 [Chloroherpeton thalassium ATCC 35110]|uniref:Uncharacterized protein n=1 Tax=Chloroherpeton thalassium (strain ATCC 35110 / GB-78) TaxID=517418 RepID=B3QUL6_CHLT3|nr:hypothetical protein [Chloroherpeton thalassium]ACF12922.1 hypothetical protein Ctha_0451 [Chloroherpeton thalassium ATCC 35110]
MPLGDGTGPTWAKNQHAGKGAGNGGGRCNGHGRRHQDGAGMNAGGRHYGALLETHGLKIEALSRELAELKAQFATQPAKGKADESSTTA